MAPPSTISEPDSGMPSLTDSVESTCLPALLANSCGAANLGRRRLSAGVLFAAFRNVGRATTPAPGLRTRNVGQAVSPAKHNHQPPAGVPSGSRQPRRAMLAFALALLLAPIAHAASIPSFSILSDDQ